MNQPLVFRGIRGGLAVAALLAASGPAFGQAFRTPLPFNRYPGLYGGNYGGYPGNYYGLVPNGLPSINYPDFSAPTLPTISPFNPVIFSTIPITMRTFSPTAYNNAFSGPGFYSGLYSPNSSLVTSAFASPYSDLYPTDLTGYTSALGNNLLYSNQTSQALANTGMAPMSSLNGGPLFSYTPYAAQPSGTFTNWPGTFQTPSTGDLRPSLLRKAERDALRPRQGRRRSTAFIDVRVPARAQVWFEGVRTQKRGSLRRFVSPALPRGQRFVYVIRARWRAKGRLVTRRRRLTVRAGDNIYLDLTSPAAR
jgi:uncharacterized protein (TIGR03000 family)